MTGPTRPQTEHTQDQELALIRAARDGDSLAFEELIGPYLGELRTVVRSSLRSHQEHDPDEALQEILITAWKALPRYIEAYRFRNYIFGIAREVVRRFLAARKREVPTDWARENSPLAGEPDPVSYENTEGRIRSLVGVDRFPAPDAQMLRSAVLAELLEVVLGFGGYPHQQLAFAFSIMLWGKPKPARHGTTSTRETPESGSAKVPITGDPDRVVRELGGSPLGSTATALETEVRSRDGMAPDQARRAFLPLEYRLGLQGKALFARDSRSSRLFDHLSRFTIRDTLLEQYFGKDPRKSIADWTERVKTRTREAIQSGLDPAVSTLPWPPGHENSDSDA